VNEREDKESSFSLPVSLEFRIEMEVRLVCLEAFFVLIFQASLVNIFRARG